MIQKLLLQTKINFKELSYISFSKGPGNFTGIRISGCIVYSLSISLNIPVIGISTLLIMAQKAWRKYKRKNIIVAIYANKKEVYWAQYVRNKKSIWTGEDSESLLKIEQVQDRIINLDENWTLIGNIWNNINLKNFLNLKQTKIFSPNAKDILPLVLLQIKDKKIFSSLEEINYLYNSF